MVVRYRAQAVPVALPPTRRAVAGCVPARQAAKAAAQPMCRATDSASSRLSVWGVDIAVSLDEWSPPLCGPDGSDGACPGGVSCLCLLQSWTYLLPSCW